MDGSGKLSDAIQAVRSRTAAFADWITVHVPDTSQRGDALQLLASVQDECEQALFEEFRSAFMLGTSGIDGRQAQ